MDKHVRFRNADSEWHELCKMSFWGLYNEKLAGYFEAARDSKKGVSDKPTEDFRYYQGKHQAFKDVLNLPKVILDELKQKAEKDEGEPSII